MSNSKRASPSFLKNSIVVIVVAVALAQLTGCATRKVAPPVTFADMPLATSGSTPATPLESATAIFQRDLVNSIQSPDDHAMAVKAYRSGLAFLNMQCGRYLDAIGSANQSASNERSQVSLIGGFTAAAMGLAGSAAKEISGLATAFSFVNSSMESYTTAFLFSDAASSVTRIVNGSRQAWLSDIESQGIEDEIKSSDAILLLDDYEKICRPSNIRALIDQSVSKGTIVAERVAASESDVTMTLQALNATLGTVLTEEQAIVLYAWLKNPAQRTAGATLSSVEPVATLLSTRTEQELASQLAHGFLPLTLARSTVRERWAPAIASLLIPANGAPAPGPAPAVHPPGQPAHAAAAGVPAPPKRISVVRPKIPVLSVR